MLLWTTHVTAEHERQLAFVRQCGFDGVEVPLFRGEPTHYRALANVLDRVGLQRTCSLGLDAGHNPIDPDPRIRRAAVDRLRWGIDCAHALGADVLCGPLHSAFKVFTGRAPTDDERRRSAEVLRAAAEHAAPARVLLAAEALNRFECHLINTVGQLTELCLAVDHPSLRGRHHGSGRG